MFEAAAYVRQPQAVRFKSATAAAKAYINPQNKGTSFSIDKKSLLTKGQETLKVGLLNYSLAVGDSLTVLGDIQPFNFLFLANAKPHGDVD